MINLELPYPPSLNGYYRHVGYRTLISREGRMYRKRICAILAAAGVVPMSGRLEATIILHPPDNRRRDCDNAMKALLDAIQHGGAYHDDSQIKELNVRMREPVRGGSVSVCIRSLDQ